MIDLDYDGFLERTESTKGDIEYIPKIRFKMNEAAEPLLDIVPGFPMNKKMKYDRNKMVTAIKNGMVILIGYKGDKDKWLGSRERIIYPLVLGINRNTKNELIRGFHLEGFSVSQKKETKKVWRLFKASNIKSMMFTGHFYRLPPKGYKMNDRVMTETTIARADFMSIRKNQEKLVQMGKIEKEEEITISQKDINVVNKIKIKDTETILDLKNPWDNELLKENKKNLKDIKISILKPIITGDWIAILGAIGAKDKTVKVYNEDKLLGSYKTIDAFTGDLLKTKRVIQGKSEFDLYTFVKKL